MTGENANRLGVLRRYAIEHRPPLVIEPRAASVVHYRVGYRWSLLFVFVAVAICGCSNTESPPQSQATCWDGSHASNVTCPALEGRAALEWALPKDPSGQQPTCAEQSPTQMSPTPESVEILKCSWPQSGSLTVERYPSPKTVPRSISDPWSVNGAPYGTTLYTSVTNDPDSSAERWWNYKGSALVFELSGRKSTVDSLSDRLAFRPPAEVLSGRG